MIDQFLQLAGSLVRIQSGDLVYSDTPENFVTDYGNALPAMPAGVEERVYEPGRRHALVAGDSVIGGGAIPWAFGDAAIAALSTLVNAQGARIGTPMPPAPADPGTYPPRLVASALQINVAGGDIPSMSGVFNVGAAIYLGVGQYMLFFIAELSNADYFPVIQDGAHEFTVTEQTTDHITVQAADAGVPIDVARFSLQVFQF